MAVSNPPTARHAPAAPGPSGPLSSAAPTGLSGAGGGGGGVKRPAQVAFEGVCSVCFLYINPVPSNSGRMLMSLPLPFHSTYSIAAVDGRSSFSTFIIIHQH